MHRTGTTIITKRIWCYGQPIAQIWFNNTHPYIKEWLCSFKFCSGLSLLSFFLISVSVQCIYMYWRTTTKLWFIFAIYKFDIVVQQYAIIIIIINIWFFFSMSVMDIIKYDGKIYWTSKPTPSKRTQYFNCL